VGGANGPVLTPPGHRGVRGIEKPKFSGKQRQDAGVLPFGSTSEMRMLRILTYHRIAEPEGSGTLNPFLISAAPREFERQMAHLEKHYQAVSAAIVLDALRGKARLPDRAVLVTFDDAYRDFAAVAWPILRHHHIPTTLFVPTAFPGNPRRAFWWDWLSCSVLGSEKKELKCGPLGKVSLKSRPERRKALRLIQNYAKTLPHREALEFVDQVRVELGGESPEDALLSWDELRKLARQGVTMGTHTSSHALLTRVPPSVVREEIRNSLADLRREIRAVLPILAYPGGAHNESILNIAREEGIEMAVTTQDGHNDLASADPLRLSRTNVTPRTTMPILHIRLSRLGARLDTWRHRRQRIEIATQQAG
jgi:peptidoglycan/xylan/chitin deacetylase (PgdA/CDA1 family)